MTDLPLEVRLALEWFRSSGDRTPTRLDNLVNHFCQTNAVDPHTTAEYRKIAQGEHTS